MTLIRLTVFFSYSVYERQYYQAACRIILSRSDPILSIMGVTTYTPRVRSYKTQMSVATSPDVCRLASEILSGRVTPEEIRGAVHLSQEPETEIVQIQVVYDKPDLSVRIANAVARAFEEYDEAMMKKETTRAIEFLKEEIKALSGGTDEAGNKVRGRIGDLQDALSEISKKEGIIDVGEQRKLDLKRLSEKEGSEAETQAKLRDVQYEVEQLKGRLTEFLQSLERVIADKAGHLPRERLIEQILGSKEPPSRELFDNLRERLLGTGAGDSHRKLMDIEEQIRSRGSPEELLAHHRNPSDVAAQTVIRGSGKCAGGLKQDDTDRALRRRFPTSTGCAWGTERDTPRRSAAKARTSS